MFRGVAGAAVTAALTNRGTLPLANNQQHVIILAGPGGRYYGDQLINSATEAFRGQGLKVTTIGDGEMSLNPKHMKELYAKVKEDNHPLLVIIAEGSMVETHESGYLEHTACLHLDDKIPTNTIDLLKEIKKARGERPLDIVSVAGNEQLLAKYVVSANLPQDSFYVSLSPFQNWFGGIQQVFDDMKETNYFKGEISAAKFLITYLALVKDIKRSKEPQTGHYNVILEIIDDTWLPLFSTNSTHLLPSWESMTQAYGSKPTSENLVRHETICTQQLSRFVRPEWYQIEIIRRLNAKVESVTNEDIIKALLDIPARPGHSTKFALPKELDGMMKAIIFSCMATDPKLRIFWAKGDKPVPVEKTGISLRQ